MAVAARRLAAGGPRDGAHFADQSAGVRRFLLGGQLVPRLCCLLWSCRRRKKDLCDGGATEPSQAGVEEGAVERRRAGGRSAGLCVSAAGVAAKSGAG